MNLKSILFICISITYLQQAYSQINSYFGGKFKISSYISNENKYTLYDFSREGIEMKAKYFATDAYNQYLNWRGSKEILYISAGAFSDGWGKNAIPVGLCVDNGSIINQTPKSEMDGMVIIYNGGAQQGGIAVVDLDKSPINCKVNGKDASYYPRSNDAAKVNFLNWGRANYLTLFQTQLVYSEKKYNNFSNLYYGKKQERRFLAICRKNGIVHHVIVDAPEDEYLNVAAKNAKNVLNHVGFSVLYMLNLDTGGKNLLYAYNGSYLYNYNPNPAESARIENATNLIIYYKD